MADPPRRPAGLTTLTAGGQFGTLIARLTPAVDRLRDLKTKLGARPYRVSLVTTRWSGGERGVGAEEVVGCCVLLPTPKVADLDGLELTIQSVGADEVGTLRVSEISPSYSEEQLRGLGPLGEEIPADHNFYWEVTYPKANGADLRRRFLPRSPPGYDAVKFQWSIVLVKASEDRERNGDPEG